MTFNQQKIKSLKETYSRGEKKSRHSTEEFGPGKQGFIFCPQGEAVYYKKSWHHTSEFFTQPFGEYPAAKPQGNIRSSLSRDVMPRGQRAGFIKTPHLKEERGIIFKSCPVHEMIKNKQYEGEIIIKNVPEKFRKDLLRLIQNMGETAERIDVLDRILELKNKEQELRITTSENQLAQKIARKIRETFAKKIIVKISRAKEGDVVNIMVNFYTQ